MTAKVQRPVEWLRLTTTEGEPGDLSRFLKLLPDRIKLSEVIKAELAKELHTTPAEITRRIAEAHAERLADNEKIIAASAAALGIDAPGAVVKATKVGSAGIDWIEVEGPVVPDDQAGDLVFGAGTGDAKDIIGDFLPRAFRRPIEPDEPARYEGIFDAAIKRGEPREEALKLALAAVLVPPNFLFREEFGGENGSYALNNHQLASRLSYFLWLSMPDDRLRRLADEGRLQEPEVLRAEVKRLTADPRSRDFSDAFLGQWLGYADVGVGHVPDAKRFRAFTPELSTAMKLEPVLVFEKLVPS